MPVTRCTRREVPALLLGGVFAPSPQQKQELYTRTSVIEGSAGKPRMPGHHKGPGFTYAHAIEHGGSLHVMFACHRDDVVIRRYDIAMLAEGLPA